MEEARLGLGGRPPRVGTFIRDFLHGVGESYASEIHSAYKLTHKGWTTLGGRRYRLCTYNSFACYVSKLILIGFIEKTGRIEKSDNFKASALGYPERVYLRLTPKGETAGDYIWSAPLRIYYHPYDWEVTEYADHVRRAKRKKIRRKAKT